MLFKLRSDRFHLCCNTQRPLPRRVSGIGIWLTVLDTMCTFAIITNMLILYFTTDEVFSFLAPGRESKMLMIIVFEHLLLALRFGLSIVIPEMPLPVKAEIRIHQLTRLVRRKKLWEKAQSRYRHKKKGKGRRRNNDRLHANSKGNRYRSSLQNDNDENGICVGANAPSLHRDSRAPQNQHSRLFTPKQSVGPRFSSKSRTHSANNIRIDDVMHAIF